MDQNKLDQLSNLIITGSYHIPACKDCGGVFLTDVKKAGLDWHVLKQDLKLCPGHELDNPFEITTGQSWRSGTKPNLNAYDQDWD